MTTRPILTFALAGLLATSATPAAAEDEPARIFSDPAQVMDVRLEGNWARVARDKDGGKTWEGTFRYTAESGAQVSIPVTISARGLTRRRVCDFPPLRLKFDDEAAEGTAFEDAGSLKMVTHCFRGTKYDQYYIKEYLAYRFYNLVTDRSYRVLGLNVAYAKDADDGRTEDRFAFLIEDPDDVAKRNDMDKLDIAETVPSKLDPLETTRHMLFQYLIGNLDWSVLGGLEDRCCHNARLIGAGPDEPPFVAIPYDLDSAGFVDAHYAAPPPGIKVRNVRQRLYRGFCAHNEQVPPVLEEFRALRPEFEAMVRDNPGLDDKPRREALEYIEEFYADLEDPGDVQRLLIDNCRG